MSQDDYSVDESSNSMKSYPRADFDILLKSSTLEEINQHLADEDTNNKLLIVSLKHQIKASLI